MKTFKNNSGVILLSALWILVILSMLVFSVGRKSQVEAYLTRHSVGKVQSRYAAWAGLIFAVEQIRLDSADQDSSSWDDQYFCGLRKNGRSSLDESFKQTKLESGYFSIAYFSPGNDRKFGLSDEDRKINLNAIDAQNYGILKSLLVTVGGGESDAELVSLALVDWKDQDSDVVQESKGAENDFYERQEHPYRCKNAFLDSLEEFMLVRGVTPELFKKIKPYITVFPKDAILMVNFDTASRPVLLALAESVAGAPTNTDISDATSLVDKLLEYRAGDDGIDGTSDDKSMDLNEISLNAKERVLFLVINQFRKRTSDMINVRVEGYDENMSSKTVLETVVQREDLSVVRWHRI